MIHSCVAALLDYDHPQDGQAAALKAIHERFMPFRYVHVERVAANEQLAAIAAAERPDWMWLQLQDTEIINASTLDDIRRILPDTVLVHWTGDARPSVSDYLSSICRATDLTLTSCKGHVEMYRRAGARRAAYLQIGLDWHEDALGVPTQSRSGIAGAWVPLDFRVPDVVFCGNHYGRHVFPDTKKREDIVRALVRARVDIGVVARRGGWPGDLPRVGECHVKRQSEIYRRAKVVLSVNHFNDIEGYYSDRQLIAMASGTPVVCHYVPGLENEFEQGVHCLWYHDVDAGVAHVKRLLADEALRKKMGAAARAEVLRNHTWFKRMVDVYTMVEAIQQERRS